LIPLVVILTGWGGSKVSKVLSKQHPVVSLAEDVITYNPAVDVPSEEVKAFNTTRETKDKLFERAQRIQKKFYIGGWILGGFLGLMIMIKIIGLSLQKKQNIYTIDTGNCLSCGRCFTYCPFELVRLGVITPDEIPDPKIKQGEF
jgi:ferredoxin